MEEVGEEVLCFLVGIHDRRGVVFQERCEVEGCGSVSVEEESGMGGGRGECGEIHCFLGPLGGICRGGVVWFRPVSEAWVVGWIDTRIFCCSGLMNRGRRSGHVGC